MLRGPSASKARVPVRHLRYEANEANEAKHFRAEQLVNPAGKFFPEMLHDFCSFCAMSKESTSSQFVSLSSVRFF